MHTLDDNSKILSNLDSQYSLMIERQGTSAQQHWSKFVKYLAAIFEGIKNAGFLGALFSSTFGFGGDESSGGIMISEISETFFGFFLFFSRLFITSKSLERN